MKILNNLVLKHLACSYVLYCKEKNNEFLSFQKYCDKYSLVMKVHTNEIYDIVNSAKSIIKKEKKTIKK